MNYIFKMKPLMKNVTSWELDKYFVEYFMSFDNIINKNLILFFREKQIYLDNNEDIFGGNPIRNYLKK